MLESKSVSNQTDEVFASIARLRSLIKLNRSPFTKNLFTPNRSIIINNETTAIEEFAILKRRCIKPDQIQKAPLAAYLSSDVIMKSFNRHVA